MPPNDAPPPVTFRDALKRDVLVLDGAMGTQLYERGILYSTCFEELNETRPEIIRSVHDDYLRGGATLIETNTFGANALRLEKHGLQGRVRAINESAVRIARAALADDRGRILPARSGRADTSSARRARRTSRGSTTPSSSKRARSRRRTSTRSTWRRCARPKSSASPSSPP